MSSSIFLFAKGGMSAEELPLCNEAGWHFSLSSPTPRGYNQKHMLSGILHD